MNWINECIFGRRDSRKRRLQVSDAVLIQRLQKRLEPARARYCAPRTHEVDEGRIPFVPPIVMTSAPPSQAIHDGGRSAPPAVMSCAPPPRAMRRRSKRGPPLALALSPIIEEDEEQEPEREFEREPQRAPQREPQRAPQRVPKQEPEQIDRSAPMPIPPQLPAKHLILFLLTREEVGNMIDDETTDLHDRVQWRNENRPCARVEGLLRRWYGTATVPEPVVEENAHDIASNVGRRHEEVSLLYHARRSTARALEGAGPLGERRPPGEDDANIVDECRVEHGAWGSHVW